MGGLDLSLHDNLDQSSDEILDIQEDGSKLKK